MKKSTALFIIGLFLLSLMPSVLAKETIAYEKEFDEDLGIVTFEATTKNAFERFFQFFQQSILVNPSPKKVGQQLTATIIPSDTGGDIFNICKQKEPFFTVKYWIVSDANTIAKTQFSGKKELTNTCDYQDWKIKFTPNKAGDWAVYYTAYIVCPIEPVSPFDEFGCKFTFKEDEKFIVESEVTDCPDQYSPYKKFKDIPNGAYYDQSILTFGSPPACEPNPSKKNPILIIKCNSGYYVEGTTQQEKETTSSTLTCVKADSSGNGGDDTSGGSGGGTSDGSDGGSCSSDLDCDSGNCDGTCKPSIEDTCDSLEEIGCGDIDDGDDDDAGDDTSGDSNGGNNVVNDDKEEDDVVTNGEKGALTSLCESLGGVACDKEGADYANTKLTLWIAGIVVFLLIIWLLWRIIR